MTINNNYKFNDIVYLKTDPEQKQRIITEINIKPNLILMYELACGSESSWHYEFEISINKDYKIN